MESNVCLPVIQRAPDPSKQAERDSVLLVWEDGIAGKHKFDSADLLRALDRRHKRTERGPVLPVLENLGHAGALCGIVLFKGKKN